MGFIHSFIRFFIMMDFQPQELDVIIHCNVGSYNKSYIYNKTYWGSLVSSLPAPLPGLICPDMGAGHYRYQGSDLAIRASHYTFKEGKFPCYQDRTLHFLDGKYYFGIMARHYIFQDWKCSCYYGWTFHLLGREVFLQLVLGPDKQIYQKEKFPCKQSLTLHLS